MQSIDRLEETSGDYLEDGYLQYGWKQNVTIESYSEYTALPTGAIVTDESTAEAKSRDGWNTFSVTFFNYLPIAAPGP
jgi:hypothetical protein